MAVMRAGVTHLQAGMIETAHELICKAYRILLVTHGPNHSVTRDLEVGYDSPVMRLVLHPSGSNGTCQEGWFCCF